MAPSKKDTVTLKLTWRGTSTAGLAYVIDNDQMIELPDDATGKGSITVTYDVPARPAHRIVWSLLFPKKTLKELSATASLNGADPEDLDASDSEDTRWASQGVA